MTTFCVLEFPSDKGGRQSAQSEPVAAVKERRFKAKREVPPQSLVVGVPTMTPARALGTPRLSRLQTDTWTRFFFRTLDRRQRGVIQGDNAFVYISICTRWGYIEYI